MTLHEPPEVPPCQCQIEGRNKSVYCDRHLRRKSRTTLRICQTNTERRRAWDAEANAVRQAKVGVGELVARFTHWIALWLMWLAGKMQTCQTCAARRIRWNKLTVPKPIMKVAGAVMPPLARPLPLTAGAKGCGGCKKKQEQNGHTETANPVQFVPGDFKRITLGPEMYELKQRRVSPNTPVVFGVTTSPIWKKDGMKTIGLSDIVIGTRRVIGKAVESMMDAGYGTQQISIFAEPFCGQLVAGIETHEAQRHLGSWANWHRALTHLREHHPKAAFYGIVQDDAIFCPGIAEMAFNEMEAVVDSDPDAAVFSFYLAHGKDPDAEFTPADESLEPLIDGHITRRMKPDDVMWGAVCYVFAAKHVDLILNDPFNWKWESGKKAGQPIPGNRIDYRVMRCVNRHNLHAYFFWPGLVQHRMDVVSSLHHTLGATMRSSYTFCGQ